MNDASNVTRARSKGNQNNQNDNDNPWESAANDEAYRSSAFRADVNVRISVDEEVTNEGGFAESSFQTRCNRFNQLYDGLLSALFTIFFFFQYHKNGQQQGQQESDALVSAMLILSVVMALLVFLRSIAGGRFLLVNMYSRVFTGLAYILFGAIFYFGAKASKLPLWMMKVLAHGDATLFLPVLFGVLSIVEVFQYFVMRHFHQGLLDDMEISFLSNATSRAMGQFSAPWWWNRARRRDPDATLDEPLLHGQPSWTNTQRDQYQESHERSSSWWPFSSRRRNHRFDDADSVDYASLNEDWASRSQADPHWWCREDDEDGP